MGFSEKRRGTAITNFHKNQEYLYRQAIDRHGDANLYISNELMNPQWNDKGTTLCLHDKKAHRDLSEFWKIFELVKSYDKSRINTELLEALKNVKKAFAESLPKRGKPDEEMDIFILYPSFKAVLPILNAAIAKAEGRNP